MPTELVKLKDGILVEIQADPVDAPKQISSGAAHQVEGSMEAAKELLLKAVKPVTEIWSQLSQDVLIEQAVIEIGLGFEASGKLFIVQGSGKANVNFKLTLKQKP